MDRINIAGKVTGEIWRVHEADKEIVCFMLENKATWFRIEYDKKILPDRADYMVEMLGVAAQEDNEIEVALEYESSPEQKSSLFHDVKYIQIRARLQPTVQFVATEMMLHDYTVVSANFRT